MYKDKNLANNKLYIFNIKHIHFNVMTSSINIAFQFHNRLNNHLKSRYMIMITFVTKCAFRKLTSSVTNISLKNNRIEKNTTT